MYGLKWLLAGIAACGIASRGVSTEIPASWNGGEVTRNGGEFQMTGAGTQTRMSRDSFAVDPAKRYRISGEFKSGGAAGGILCFGLAPATAAGQVIYSVCVNALSGTDGELTAAAAAGATEIQVSSADRWRKQGQSAVAFGTRPDRGDLPNFEIAPIAGIDGHTVKLREPLKRAWPAGTAVREHVFGDTYMFGGAAYQKLSDQWTTFSGVIAGENPTGSEGGRFWRGTKRAHWVIMTDCPDLRFRNLRWEEVADSASPAMETRSGANAPVNVRDYGAVGDGVADDTAAVQRAIDAALNPAGGELFIPAGKYRITRTLHLNKARVLRVYGQGDSVMHAKESRASSLIWDGPAGGTLLKAEGFGNVIFERFNLSGRPEDKPREAGSAGVLFHSISLPGYGSGWNTFRNLSLHKARIGFLMGGDDSVDMCNSDMQFSSIGMFELESGFQTRNSQALNFIFHYLNAYHCGTVLDFLAGGNLEVHNATLSGCDTYLKIGQGGRCIGTYVNINVRLENYPLKRSTLVSSHPSNCQANVKFISFDDSQCGWPENQTETRGIPLCDIGPGTAVVIESSIFNGVVARLEGAAAAPASLVLRECSFGWLAPVNTVSANPFGYFKIIHPLDDHMRILPDVVKWPVLNPLHIAPDQVHQAAF